MIKCPECDKEIKPIHGRTLRALLQNHLWGSHSYPVMESHLKAIELCRDLPKPPAAGERNAR